MLQYNLYFIFFKKTKQNQPEKTQPNKKPCPTSKPKRAGSGIRSPHLCSAQLHPAALFSWCHTSSYWWAYLTV